MDRYQENDCFLHANAFKKNLYIALHVGSVVLKTQFRCFKFNPPPAILTQYCIGYNCCPMYWIQLLYRIQLLSYELFLHCSFYSIH